MKYDNKFIQICFKLKSTISLNFTFSVEEEKIQKFNITFLKLLHIQFWLAKDNMRIEWHFSKTLSIDQMTSVILNNGQLFRCDLKRFDCFNTKLLLTLHQIIQVKGSIWTFWLVLRLERFIREWVIYYYSNRGQLNQFSLKMCLKKMEFKINFWVGLTDLLIDEKG